MILKTHKHTGSVDCAHIIFLFPIGTTHNFSVSSFAKLSVHLVGWSNSLSIIGSFNKNKKK